MAFSFAKVPNHYLEALASSDLSSLELKIALAVIRYSIGFNRKHCDRLTLRGIARACGRKWGSNVSAAINGLVARNVIELEEMPDRAGRRRLRIWLLSSKGWRLKRDGEGATIGDGDDTTTQDEFNPDTDVLNPDMGVRVRGADPSSSLVPDGASNGAGSRATDGDAPIRHRQEIEKRERNLDNRDLRSRGRSPFLRSFGERNGKSSLSDEQRREIKTLVASMLDEGEG